MEALITTFLIPNWISTGLANGLYERVGGVIREAGTKQVVAWLRDYSSISTESIPLPSGLPTVDPVTGVLRLAISAVNTGVAVKGFANVNQRLDGIGQQLGVIEQNLQHMQGVLQITSAASILNLGVSTTGFAVIAYRLGEVEQRLQKAQEVLNKINRKIDFGFYARFRAALDLAANAFTMSKPENRRSSALAAINLFLETEYVYADYVDQELEQKNSGC